MERKMSIQCFIAFWFCSLSQVCTRRWNARSNPRHQSAVKIIKWNLSPNFLAKKLYHVKQNKSKRSQKGLSVVKLKVYVKSKMKCVKLKLFLKVFHVSRTPPYRQWPIATHKNIILSGGSSQIDGLEAGDLTFEDSFLIMW